MLDGGRLKQSFVVRHPLKRGWFDANSSAHHVPTTKPACHITTSSTHEKNLALCLPATLWLAANIAISAAEVSFRGPDDKIPYDSRPRLRILFHGVTPETEAGRALYDYMSPVSYVRKDLPPPLICDGEKDPIVPGLHGKALCEKPREAGAEATYWMTPGGGHDFPGGPGFDSVLENFLVRSLKLDSTLGR